jgi:hypothetical protein
MMTRFEKSISGVLNIPEISTDPGNKPIIDVSPQKDNSDYEYARGNLYQVIESGHDALTNMLEIAKASEHPRAFEVVNQLMKTMADAQKDLLELKKRQKDLVEPEQQQGPTTVNNALFVGSTAELQQLINGKNED